MASWKNTILEWNQMSQEEDEFWMNQVCKEYLKGVEFDVVAVRFDLTEADLFGRFCLRDFPLRDEDIKLQRKRRKRGDRQVGATGAPGTQYY